MSWRGMDAINLTQQSKMMNTGPNSLNRVNQTVNGKPVALKGARWVWVRGMGKHTYREVRRCALSLLHEAAVGSAMAPPTVPDMDAGTYIFTNPKGIRTIGSPETLGVFVLHSFKKLNLSPRDRRTVVDNTLYTAPHALASQTLVKGERLP